MIPAPNRWRMHLDPRDPDWIGPDEDEEHSDDEADADDDYPTDDELNCYASQRENDWRPAL